jgi:hypothetical protein
VGKCAGCSTNRGKMSTPCSTDCGNILEFSRNFPRFLIIVNKPSDGTNTIFPTVVAPVGLGDWSTDGEVRNNGPRVHMVQLLFCLWCWLKRRHQMPFELALTMAYIGCTTQEG